jgi:hypothetical protein
MLVDSLGRAVGLYRRTAVTRSAIALLIANAIPLVGVLFFGWSLLTILVLYWVENGIVGLWTLSRIALARGSLIPVPPEMPSDAAMAATGSATRAATLQEAWRQARAAQLARAEGVAAGGRAAGRAELAAVLDAAMGGFSPVLRIGLAGFFLIHYGIFWTVHGIFVFALPEFAGGSAAFGEVSGSMALAAVALFISHGASFFLNYLGRGEYRTTSPTRAMAAPYGRVVILHLTIIFGAFVVAFLGSPIGALLVLVTLKTAFDLGLHLREHRAAPAP